MCAWIFYTDVLHVQGTKLQYGRVALYSYGDDDNAKQFKDLHAVQRHMVSSTPAPERLFAIQTVQQCSSGHATELSRQSAFYLCAYAHRNTDTALVSIYGPLGQQGWSCA